MSAQKLTRLAAKTATIGSVGRGFESMTAMDIAHACAGMPGYVYNILLVKYVYPESEQRPRLLRRVYAELVGVSQEPEALERAIAAFCSNNICPKCNGTGLFRRPNRHVIDCKPCGGFGIVAFKIAGEVERLYQMLSDAEVRALESLQRNLN